MSFLADLLEPRLLHSHTSIAIPLYQRIVFVRLLTCSEFSSRLSKISPALDMIAGIQFRVGDPRKINLIFLDLADCVTQLRNLDDAC